MSDEDFLEEQARERGRRIMEQGFKERVRRLEQVRIFIANEIGGSRSQVNAYLLAYVMDEATDTLRNISNKMNDMKDLLKRKGP